jgi:hypothetical protein
MTRFALRKADHETWLGVALRIGRAHGAEDEVSQVFSACIRAKLSPYDSAWAALFECGLLEWEIDLE